jgi:hypothetical protein
MGRILLLSFLVLVYLFGAVGCARALPKSVSDQAKIPPKSAFEQIKYGSTYEEVEKELGQNGSLVSESQNEVFTRKIYRWGDGKTPCRVYLSFSNGKLTFKKYSGKCN